MRKKIKKREIKLWMLMPIIIFATITPLIVKMKLITIPLVHFAWMADTIAYVDVFTYYKGVAIIASAILAIVIGIYLYFNDYIEFKIDKYKIIIGVSLLFVLLATLLSKYKFASLWGYISRAEGGFVLFAYLIMVMYIAVTLRKKKHFKIILYSLYVVGIIMGIIGILQIKGNDIFRMEFIKKLILTKGIDVDDVKFAMAKDRVYLTLFNPNYVGTYVTLLLSIGVNFIIRSKFTIEKILWAILSILLLLSLFGSYSEAGFVGLVFAILATLIINYKIIWKNKIKFIVFFFAVVLIAGIGINKYKDHTYIKSIKRTLTTITKKIDTPLKSIKTKGSVLGIVYNGEKLKLIPNIKNPLNDYYIYNEKNEILEIKKNDEKNNYYVVDDKYNIVISFIKHDEYYGYKIYFDGRPFQFLLYNDEFKYINPQGELVDLREIEHIDVDGYEHLGSGRFYIWSRTIPLLKKTVLLGYGPDNFTYIFPQEDYVGKYKKNVNMLNTIVDKPHNMYLQYAVNIGVIPLILILLLISLILSKLFMIVKLESLEEEYLLYASLTFSAIIGFMAVGLFNDSTVNVSSIFWTMIGLGLALIYLDEKPKVIKLNK